MKRALLLIDHGSRVPEANAVIEGVARHLRAMDGSLPVHVAHMELAPPSIDDAARALEAEGVGEVIVVPFFLGPGRHVGDDIPRLVAAALGPRGVIFRVTEPLGAHPLLADLVRIRAGL